MNMTILVWPTAKTEVLNDLALFVGAAAADVLPVAAGDLRQLARVADTLGQAEAGAAAARPLAKPAPQSGANVIKLFTAVMN